MDPDAALNIIRDASTATKAALDRADADALWNHANDLVTTLDGLDRWLTDGGYLPAAWERSR